MNEEGLSSQAASIFLIAAGYIRQYGWQKEGMGRHGYPRCSMGALASAHQEKLLDKDLASLMYHELYNELNGLSLTEFNHQYDDGEKVAQLFERVANKLQNSYMFAAA